MAQRKIAHALVKYYLYPIVSRVYGTKYDRIINTKHVLKTYSDLLPKRADAPDCEYKQAAAAIFIPLIMQNHKDKSREIKKKFGIDIEKYLHGYIIAKSIGVASAYGTLYYVYGPENFDASKNSFFKRRHVLKIQKNRRGEFGLAYEAHIHKKFAAHNLAPKILCDHHLKIKGSELGIIIMNKYSLNTVEQMFARDISKADFDRIFEGVVRILNLLCKHNLIHGDLHWGNVGIDFDEHAKCDDWPFTLSLLDFGQSTTAKCNMQLELLQLLRTIGMMEFKNKSMRSHLERRLYTYYKSKFCDKLQMNFHGANGYDNMHNKVWNDYMNRVYIPKARAFLSSRSR